MTSRDALFIFSCQRFPRLFLRTHEYIRIRSRVSVQRSHATVYYFDSDVIWRERKCITDVSDIELYVDRRVRLHV